MRLDRDRRSRADVIVREVRIGKEEGTRRLSDLQYVFNDAYFPESAE